MKKALLVGINKYNGAPLNGCVNDVNLMQSILTGNNFNVNKLIDNQATKQNIITGLNWLVADAKPGDYLVFHYSGHGSQVPDMNRDENDGLDEILCPFDLITFSGAWTRNFITDDEIGDILSRVPKNVTIELFMDCCHSGTLTRSILNSSYEQSKRFLIPPRDLISNIEVEKVKQFGKDLNNTEANVILWSGCKDDQTSADAYIGNKYHGAFTFTFSQNLQYKVRNDVYKHLVTDIKRVGFAQDPQLSCNYASLASVMFDGSTPKVMDMVGVGVKKLLGM